LSYWIKAASWKPARTRNWSRGGVYQKLYELQFAS